MIRVGVYGASGYMGGEVLRVLNEHPEVEIVWATSRSGHSAEEFHRNLYDTGIKLTNREKIDDVDVVFFAVPSGIPMHMAQDVINAGIKIIDLGADFRLKNKEDWERHYGQKHTAWDIAQQAVYGIPELHRDEIKNATVIANPGCYSSAAIFGLAPLIDAGIAENDKIVVDGLSGTAGAGAGLDLPIHHPEIANNIVAYNVVDHRHTYEMEQELNSVRTQSSQSSTEVKIHFTSSYIPITRGILAICHVFPTRTLNRNLLLEMYSAYYAGEFFIKIFDMPKDPEATWQYKPYPWVSAVSGTNFCHIGLDYDEKRERIVVFSALDSIGKGGAHAGVQNMNILFGLDETTGLKRQGLHPY